MGARVILDDRGIDLTLIRLCHHLLENHPGFENTALIGLQPRGVLLKEKLLQTLPSICDKLPLHGNLDIAFYRDDFRRGEKPLQVNETDITFSLEGLNVVLIDDVLYTGRSVRAGLDALLAFGRPSCVELLVLIDRRYGRHLPIQPDYTGKVVDAINSERVEVIWEGESGKSIVLSELGTSNG
ncbi:MAG: bifunctional pyr operon transcriptional regulator/uracil phosphoribosyltransferase PyrR [Flavobacteriales bacterium]|nr:bifunctional pyr operon transcriptional regulator/uracil phosphoribosyltransferase PyrR [Flavobacteriales bacterium]